MIKNICGIFAFLLIISFCYASTDSNWGNNWQEFDTNIKQEYQLLNENTLHWHDLRYFTKTQADLNWLKYLLINADINWSQLQNYPSSCPTGEVLQAIGDSTTCISVSNNDTNWQTSYSAFDSNVRSILSSISKTQFFSFFDDFDGSITGKYWTAVNNGANSVETLIDSVPGENTYGVIAITKGTTGSGRAALIRGTGSVLLGQGSMIITTKLKIPTAPGPTQQFNIQLGLHDATSTDAVDGVYFKYAPKDTGDARIDCVTSNNSTRTTTNSGILMDTTWRTYKILINSSGTEALFYINENLVCTHTTNIPTAATRVTGPRLQILNNGGSGAESMYVDFWAEQINFTTPR